MFFRHCDHEGCDTHQRAVSLIPGGWWTLTSDDDREERHFCDADHLMRWAAANSEPLEVIG